MTQRYFRFAGYLLPVFIVCTSVALLGAKAKPSGWDPYTPTKLEWLCVRYNMTQLRHWNVDIPYDHYAQPDGENEIRIVLIFKPLDRYDPMPYRKMANAEMANARRSIQALAKTYGFDDWLVIREDFQDLSGDKAE